MNGWTGFFLEQKGRNPNAIPWGSLEVILEAAAALQFKQVAEEVRIYFNHITA